MQAKKDDRQDAAGSLGSAAARRVFLDPDGSFAPGWLGVIVAAKTGVIYASQCAGVGCDQREQEGYYVPLGRLKLDAGLDAIDTWDLTLPFHEARGCDWTRVGDRMPPECLAALESAVAVVPFWTTTLGKPEERGSLRLDRTRLAEVAEAWVPVVTPDGPGILVWENCD